MTFSHPAAIPLAAVLLAAALPAAAQSTGILAHDGVTLAGTSRALTYGEAEADVVARATAAYGSAPVRTQANCRNGVFDLADWGKGLKLVFQGGKFVGWQADRTLDPGYVSRAGIGFARPVSEMQEHNGGLILATAVRGREFGFDGMWGQVLQPGGAATLDALWGGTNCSRR